MQNQIPKNWQKVKVEGFGKVITGKTPPTAQKDYFEGEFPFITPTDITNYDVRYNYTTERFVSEKWADKAKSLLIPKNSTCFVCIGSTIGKMCLVKQDSFTNQQINSVVVNNLKVDPLFIYYLLKQNQRGILKEFGGGGAAKPIINKSTFEQIELEVPEDVSTQKQIATILSAFDDKIEINNKTAKTLEEMAQALFKEWFVYFRFPGYEKAEFIDSEFGKIPKEWEVKVLSDYLDLRGGLSYKAEYLTSDRGEGLPLITMGSVSQTSRLNFDGLKYYKGNYSERNLLRSGDIAIATRDVTQERTILASPVIIPSILPKSILATNMYLIENKGKVPQLFLFHLFKTRQFRERILGSAKGSNILMLTRDSVLDFNFVLPTKELIDRFDNLATIISQKVENLTMENQKLSALRDLLLPKLMKGEIGV